MIDDGQNYEASFLNYIEDAWVRSLDCRDWIRRFKPYGISHGWNENQIEQLRLLYKNIIEYLGSHVMLVDAQGAHPTESINFHKRYGWVLTSRRAKSYLGKVSIPEETPIEIGRQTYISGHAVVRGRDHLRIGSFTAIAEGLYLNTSVDLHPMEYASLLNFKTERRCCEDGISMDIAYTYQEHNRSGIEIGSDVWIGREVRIFHGTHIAHGSVIAERSLVRGTTEPYGIYAGIPARLKRFRFSESVVSALLDIRWWEWPIDRLLRNKQFFATNLCDSNSDITKLVKD